MATTNPTNYNTFITPQMPVPAPVPVPVPANTSTQPGPVTAPTPMPMSDNMNGSGVPGDNINGIDMGRANIVGRNTTGNDAGRSSINGSSVAIPNPPPERAGGNNNDGVSGHGIKGGGVVPAGGVTGENENSLRNGALAATTGGTHTLPRQPRVIIKHADMPQDMQRKAINLALTALERYELERDMAYFLKREFDERFQPSWHCIVGRHFGSFVTHDGSGFLYFYIDKTAVLLFRSGS